MKLIPRIAQVLTEAELSDRQGRRYELRHKINMYGKHQYDVYDPDNGRVASAELRKDKPMMSSLFVQPEYQRRGITSKLYDYVERDLSIILLPNPALTAEGGHSGLRAASPRGNFD